MTKEKDNPECPAPGRWFYYTGKWKKRKNDLLIIFLRRHIKHFPKIYPISKPQPNLNYFNLKDRSRITQMALALATTRNKRILKKHNYQCVSCDRYLLEEDIKFHYILPIQFGEKDEDKNLILLCKQFCYK